MRPIDARKQSDCGQRESPPRGLTQ
jgi:hypothetical protein